MAAFQRHAYGDPRQQARIREGESIEMMSARSGVRGAPRLRLAADTQSRQRKIDDQGASAGHPRRAERLEDLGLLAAVVAVQAAWLAVLAGAAYRLIG
jgi:hypothetical protein